MTTAASPITSSERMPSPVGELTLLATSEGLAGIYFEERYEGELPVGGNEFTAQAAFELGEYFEGRRRKFTVPLDLFGTDFQRSVWNALQKVAFGDFASYRDIAEVIDNPKAVRAVGLANGANPVSIIVPCHRIIGSNGSLTGYGGGLDRKTWLLQHEGLLVPELF